MPKIPQHDAHHIVFGAGLIGSYLGACLIKAKQQVTLYGREELFSKLQHNFKIADYSGHHYTVPQLPHFMTSIEQKTTVEKADVVWLTVKCTALTTVIDELSQLVDESTIIICCQNGVGNHKIIKNAFPQNQVIRAMIPFNVVSDSPGDFFRGSEGHMTLEITAPMENTVIWLARQLDCDLLPVDISHNMTALQWAKLQLNLGNAMNALVDMPVKAMLENKKYRLIIALMMDELLKITEKQKIKLPKVTNLPNKWIPKVLRLPNWLFNIVAQKMLAIDPKVRTSMYWDLKNGKKTEIDFINGKVVDEAAKFDISVPANRLVTALIKKREQGKQDTNDELEKRFSALLKSR
ncbi:2-dehydropantoate 2-reductase [Glaciecola sp. 1036]|uniref:2-dehydropantoate 2-reductase n=1 Tax=Alteromonadaceae TaxID=72275 RepID=UPI003D054BE0